MKKLSILFMSLCFAFVVAGCSKAKVESQYLIPEGYIGWIHIIYDQSKAAEIKKVDGVYTFPIGKDGILKVSNKDADYNAYIGKFFYVDEKGNTVRELD